MLSPPHILKNFLGQKKFESAEFNTVRMPIAFYAFFLQILWLSLPMGSRKNGKKPPRKKLSERRPTAGTF